MDDEQVAGTTDFQAVVADIDQLRDANVRLQVGAIAPGASARDGEDGLLFALDADLAAVEEILESYKSPKGS